MTRADEELRRLREAAEGKTQADLAADLRVGLNLEARRLEWLNANLYAWPGAYGVGAHIVHHGGHSLDALCGAEVVHVAPHAAELAKVCRRCKAAAAVLAAQEVLE